MILVPKSGMLVVVVFALLSTMAMFLSGNYLTGVIPAFLSGTSESKGAQVFRADLAGTDSRVAIGKQKQNINSLPSPKGKLEVVYVGGDKVTLVTQDGDTNGVILSPSLSLLSPAPVSSDSFRYETANTPLTATIVNRPSPTYTPVPIGSISMAPIISVTPTPAVTPTPSLSATPEASGHVVINEVAWMGTEASSTDEWIELYNPTANPIDMTGWMLRSLTGTKSDPNFVFSENNGNNLIIEAFGCFLLERTDDNTIQDITADLIYTGNLSNEGEKLELLDSAGNRLDFVDGSGGWPAGDNIQKATMERIKSAVYAENSENWLTSNGTTRNGHDSAGNAIKGTPGTKNSVSDM